MTLKDVRQIIKKTKSAKKYSKSISSKRKRGGDDNNQCRSLIIKSIHQFLLELKSHIPTHINMIENNSYAKFTFIKKILRNEKIIKFLSEKIKTISSIIYEQLTQHRVNQYCMIHDFLNNILGENIIFKIELLQHLIQKKDLLFRIFVMHTNKKIDINNLLNIIIPYIIHAEEHESDHDHFANESIYGHFVDDIFEFIHNIIIQIDNSVLKALLDVYNYLCKIIKLDDNSIRTIKSYISIKIRTQIQQCSRIFDILRQIDLNELFEKLEINEKALMNLIEIAIDSDFKISIKSFEQDLKSQNFMQNFLGRFQILTEVVQKHNSILKMHEEIKRMEESSCTRLKTL